VEKKCCCNVNYHNCYKCKSYYYCCYILLLQICLIYEFKLCSGSFEKILHFVLFVWLFLVKRFPTPDVKQIRNN